MNQDIDIVGETKHIKQQRRPDLKIRTCTINDVDCEGEWITEEGGSKYLNHWAKQVAPGRLRWFEILDDPLDDSDPKPFSLLK